MLINRRTTIALCLATFLLYAWPMYRWLSCLDQRPAAFSAYLPSISDESHSPFITEEFITPGLNSGAVHASSICQLSDGTLGAAWYAGSREGGKDVAIYFAVRGPGEHVPWSKSRAIVNRKSASKELRRFIRKLGNPLLFADSKDRFWLLYVTVTIGGWSGSSLNLKISDDGGMTWTQSIRLTLSPFFNVSELVRNSPLPMKDGSFGIPIYHECMGKFPEMLWIWLTKEDQKIGFRKTRMVGGRMFIQPSVVVCGSHKARAFYRNCSDERAVGTAFTGDTGATWSRPRMLCLPNPDSGLSALALSEGRILLAFNDSKRNRDILSLAVSSDGGANWLRIGEIENNPGHEFSYPYLIRTQDGRIHLVYTWRRKRIKHVVFNENWLNAQIKRVSK